MKKKMIINSKIFKALNKDIKYIFYKQNNKTICFCAVYGFNNPIETRKCS